MKYSFLKVVFFVLLLTVGINGQASANSDLNSMCAAFGDIQPNENPSYQHINCLLTSAAIEANVPSEVVKAVATQENGDWKQFDDNGHPVISEDGGIGLMQITNKTNYDQDKLKNDIVYNIQVGVQILGEMYERKDLPKIQDANRQKIENWYFPVMAYNGIKPVNSPIFINTGLPNLSAYQEEVFTKIEKHSFLNDTKLAEFYFTTADFDYDPTSDKNIVFVKKEYVVTEPLHESLNSLKIGEEVVVTEDNVNMRSQPGTLSSPTILAENTKLIITGNPLFDQNIYSKNQFVWFPVRTPDGKVEGYIASSYITKATGIFPDLEVTNRFYNDIYYLSKSNVITGFVDGTFRPNEIVSRGQAAIMIIRAFHIPIETVDTPFTDVHPTSKAAGYIAAAHERGIISGYPDKTFRPNEPVTRGAMAIFLARAFQYQDKAESSFTDINSNMKAYDSIQKIIAANITFGFEDNTYRPDIGVTRASFSAFLYRGITGMD